MDKLRIRTENGFPLNKLTNESTKEAVNHGEDGQEVQRIVECRFGRPQDVGVHQWSQEHHHDQSDKVEDQNDCLTDFRSFPDVSRG